MDILDQYGMYIHYFVWILVSAFFVLGSVLIHKSQRSKITYTLLISSSIIIIAQICGCYFQFQAFGLSNTINYSDPIDAKNFDTLIKYMNYSFYIQTLFSAIFAFAFAAFCCKCANLRKRNDQLEVLNQQLAQRTEN